MGLQEINERLSQIKESLRSASTIEEIETLTKESEDLLEKRGALMADERNQAAQAIEQRAKEQEEKIIKDKKEMNTKLGVEISERSKAELLQNRSLKLGDDVSNNFIHVEKDANHIVPGFNVVSSIIDMVSVVNAIGAEAYNVPYEKDPGTAAYVGEGVAATETDAQFGVAPIAKAKIVAYTEISEEFEKLSHEVYLPKVIESLKTAFRRKVAQEIVGGDGTANHLTGIFSKNATAIEATKDIAMKALNSDSLDDVYLKFGSTESLDGTFCYHIMNKETLFALRKVKATDGRPFYDINLKECTLNGEPVVLSSNLKPFSTAVAATDYVWAYGRKDAYELAMFSPLEVQRSTDYKFKEGMVGYKATGILGGNVVKFNGFVRVKKGA